MRIAITGPTGNVGTALLQALAADGSTSCRRSDWAPSLEQPAIRPDPDRDTPPEGDKGPGAPADEDTPDPDEYADPDAPSR